MKSNVDRGPPSAKPILFSASMVRALLEGRKTQTRRLVKPQPTFIQSSGRWKYPLPKKHNNNGRCEAVYTASREWWEYLPEAALPYGKPGDLLWVRETWRMDSRATDLARVCYRASERASHTEFHEMIPVDKIGNMQTAMKWKSPLHMPRWASRLTLEITDVRVQRLQDISKKDAEDEGVYSLHSQSPGFEEVAYYRSLYDPKELFRMLWTRINGPTSWDENPWVWALTFEVHHCNVDKLLPFLKAA